MERKQNSMSKSDYDYPSCVFDPSIRSPGPVQVIVIMCDVSSYNKRW